MTMDFKKKLVGAWKSILIVVAVLVAIAGLIVLFRYDSELAKFTAYLLGGGLLLWQVWTSSQRAKAAEETAKAMQKTADTTEKGNIAERFKNAIEHLGHESPSVRMGSIYALHHIAQEVDDYRERVFEILCAHIRETTTQKEYKPQIIPRVKTNSEAHFKPSIEIESILRLLFCEPPDRRIYEGLRANLDNANLLRANLMHSNIQNARFFSADLQCAGFFYSNLQESGFSNANLYNAFFIGTELQGANFSNSILWKTKFADANLQGCNFLNANLKEATFINAKNLTAEQLLEAKTLYKAKLPDGMEAEIKQEKPELFEEPKPDNEPEA